MGTVARQASWITVLTVAGMGLGFVNMAWLYPKFLTADEFGLTRLLVSIAVVAAQVAHLGGENTAIRYFPYFRGRGHDHRGLFGLILSVATVGGLASLAVLVLLHDRFVVWINDGSGLYARYGLWVLPLVMAEVWLLVLRGFSRSVGRSIGPVLAREFLLRVLQTALILAYAVLGLGFLLFLQLYIATFLLTTGVVLWDLWRSGELRLGLGRMRIGRRTRLGMLRYSLFTLASSVAAIAVGNIDQVMVGAMLPEGLSHVAYYAVALFMASVVMVPARALLQPVIPVMAQAWKERDHAKLQMLYQRTAIIQLVAAAFILLGLWVNADSLFSFLDPAYAVGIPVMLVLGVTNVLNLATGLSAGLVITSRGYWFDAVSGALLLVLNVVLDYFFILWWGLIGAAWSSFVSVVVVVGWRVIFLQRRFGLWPFNVITLRAAIMVLAVAAVFGFLPHAGPPVVDIAWRSALLALVYGTSVHLLGLAPDLGHQAAKLARGLLPYRSKG